MSSINAHTTEPWSIDGAKIYGGNCVLVTTVAYCHQEEANARRIVACVNACAHISTESLESGLQQNLISRARFAEEWVEELLDVLKPIIALDDGNKPDLCPYVAEFNAARSVVERIEHERRNNAS